MQKILNRNQDQNSTVIMKMNKQPMNNVNFCLKLTRIFFNLQPLFFFHILNASEPIRETKFNLKMLGTPVYDIER